MAEIQKKNNSELLDVKKIFFKSISKWYLFLLSISLSIFVSYLINKYTVPIYEISLDILIEDKKENALINLLGKNPFQEKKDISNEIAILKSYDLAKETIDSLDF